MTRRAMFPLMALAIMTLVGVASAQESANDLLHAVPPPGAVAIDGKLDDWDLSGRIDVFPYYRTRDLHSVKVAAMYDKECFYLAFAWRDPTPMHNMMDADSDAGRGWCNDCVQLRLITDMPLHVDCWYSAASKRPVINVAYGSHRPGPVNAANYAPILDPITSGAKQAFVLGDDGKGYTQEIALPWKLITGQNATVKATGKPFAAPRVYQAGDTFSLNTEFIWGGVDGRGSRSFRYVDMTREGCSNRSFYPFALDKLPYREDDLWGTVRLEPQGRLNLPAPDYAAAENSYPQKTAGPVKLTYTMPFEGFATLVIEDKDGRRVRNLIGMAPRAKGEQTDYWDCTGEDGTLVPAGKYRFRGLLHKGIEPVYRATYGNPGNPPWETSDGTGGWLSDIEPPRAVAAAENLVVLGADEASECGSSIICTDLNGRKKWGDNTRRGVHSLAADDKSVYVSIYRKKRKSWPDWNTRNKTWTDDSIPPSLARFDLKTGRPLPFLTKSGPQFSVPVLKEGEKIAGTAGIATAGDRLAISIPDLNVVRFFDKETAAIVGELPLPKPSGLAYDAAGTLYVRSGNNVIKVVDGKPTPFMNNPLKHPDDGGSGAMTVGAGGQILLADRATNQVKVYDKAGTFVRAIGVEGGRPPAGKWQANGMLNPASIAVDSQGRLWVAEEDLWPKRISVWGIDGSLARDFIGPASYNRAIDAGVAADDETRVFGAGCEFKLDYGNARAEMAVSFRKELSGKWLKAEGRDYLADGNNYMATSGSLFLRKGDEVRHVAKVDELVVSNITDYDKITRDCGGIYETQDGYPLPPWQCGASPGTRMFFIWTDLTGDGRHQPEELLLRSPWTGWIPDWKYPVARNGDWLDESFALYGCAGEAGFHGAGARGPFLTRTPLKGWAPSGAPVWDIGKQRLLSENKYWKIQLLTDGMLFGSDMNSRLLTCLRVDDGSILWTYRNTWPNTQESNSAPMPDRDDWLICPMTCIGKARTPAGQVFAMNSKMGRLYLMTTDGLFVASVFQDFRGCAEPWPNEAKPGTPLSGMTMGDLWWGGHFFRGPKSKAYYLIAGSTAYNVIQLNGLDALKTIPGGAVTVTDKDLTAAAELLPKPAAPETANPAGP